MIIVWTFIKEKIWPFLKKYWVVFALILACVLGAGLTKAFMKPEVVEKTKIQEVIKEVVVEKKVYVKQKNTTTDVSKDIHKETTTTQFPDGTKVTKEVVDKDINKHKAEAEIVYKDRIVEKQVEVEKKVEVLKEIKNPNDWRVGVDVATNIPSFSLQRPMFGVGNESNFTFGLRADRRIVGPVWLGAAGYLNGTVLIGVSAEF